MSYVTNVLLSFSVMEDADGRVAEVNDHLAEHSRGQKLGDIWQSDPPVYGGHKCMERPLYGAAFNYVEVKRFIEAVRSASWKEPEYVQVFICDQEDDVFTETKL